MKKLLFFAAIVLVYVSCFSENESIQKDEIFRLTKAANDESLKGHIEKDADKITAVYTSDAVLLPPGGIKPIVGIESIRNYYKKGFEGSGRSIGIVTENLKYDVVNENNTIELGSYTIQYKKSDTSAITEIKGEMLIVWKRIDDHWKIHMDMWH